MKDLFSGNSQDYNADAWPATKATEAMARTHFQNLTGLELDYYGADAGDHTFKVDDIVFKVLEDPNDGYRSCLGTIDYTDEHNSIFFRTPVARVRIETYEGRNREYSQGDQGYQLVDITDGHVWLEFGTDNTDDYYPCFVFRHMPKATPLKASLGDIDAHGRTDA